MQVDFKEVCRGEGKTYVRVHVRSLQAMDDLNVRGMNYNGEELPCRLLTLRTVEDAGFLDYVLVAFTSKQRQTIVFEERDRHGAVVEAVSKSISPSRSKWTSRYNGLFRKKECAAIRNLDWKGLQRQSILTFNQYVGKDDSFLLRGSLFTNCQSERDAFITIYDGHGNRLACKVIFLSDAVASPWDKVDSTLREYRFSVELPYPRKSFENYCFFAGNKHDEFSTCLEALEPHQLEALAEEHKLDLRDASVDPDYKYWIKTHSITESRARLQRATAFAYAPLFSIIVPLYMTPLDYFKEMVDSVLRQTYERWELILVNASPEDKELTKMVALYAETDVRISIVTLSQNLGITENTNEGIKASTGDFLCFFDHDDVIEANILFEYCMALNAREDIDLLYCDEDKLFPDGSYGAAMFKPDFSIDLLRDNNYICHMLTVRRSLHQRLVPADAALDGAQDHNLTLQVAEKGRRIHHVPLVLYHWRMSETSTAANAGSKPYATQAGILAVQRHLDRLGIRASVSCAHGRDFRYKVDYAIEGNPQVSLIVPTQGHGTLCELLESLQGMLSDDLFEVVLVARQDDLATVKAIIRCLNASGRLISLASYTGCFNYSKAVNLGCQAAAGDVLVLLHDDVVIPDASCIRTLVSHCMREGVGAAGPMVCDLDGTIQQAGLAFVNGEVIPLSPGLYRDCPGYAFRPLSTQNVSAVSGVCLATKRTLFESLMGFDERFSLFFSDVDYCFRIQEQGDLIVYTPEAVVSHRGSLRRGREAAWGASAGFYREKSLLLDRWSALFAEGDRYLNKNFSHVPHEASLFKLDSEEAITL